ncbi:MAG: hypothetical protein HQM10_04745 [Candidatus Riflebacteria bacterium]|nr:hypothetical protein [Candidatus Riflebacteria bacterium]
MKTKITFSLPPGPLQIGVLEADGVKIRQSSEKYLSKIKSDIAHILQPGWVYPDAIQKGIRSLLKTYGFHPSGRNRPASEFLAKDLQARGEFKPINNVVDINNHVSMLSFLPISVIDRAKDTEDIILRTGTEAEEYVFNKEGQVLSLKNLLVLARNSGNHLPVGSPVKDSQETKVFEDTRNILVVIYSSCRLISSEKLSEYLCIFSEYLKSEALAERVEHQIFDALH